MSAIADARFNALRAQGFTGAADDMLVQWLQSNGATSDAISDAWLQMLEANGFGPTNGYAATDGWYALLTSLGYTGAISDMSLQFWANGGTLTKYTFNGVDQYATMPEWNTLGAYAVYGSASYEFSGDSNDIIDLPPPVDEFGRVGLDYHDGYISNLKLNDLSPIQNTTVKATSVGTLGPFNMLGGSVAFDYIHAADEDIIVGYLSSVAGVLTSSANANTLVVDGTPYAGETVNVGQHYSISFITIGGTLTTINSTAGIQNLRIVADEGAPPEPPGKYPSYWPDTSDFVEPGTYPADNDQIFYISLANSNAAGALRTMDDEPINIPAKNYTNVWFIYEPGEYIGMYPKTLTNWYYAAGCRIIHKTTIPGQVAKFIDSYGYSTLQIKTGANIGAVLNPDGSRTGEFYGRLHVELEDIWMNNTSTNPDAQAAIHIDVSVSASTGKFITVYMKNCTAEGGKNCFFTTSSAEMVYVEGCTFINNRGVNTNQEHLTYQNGNLVSEFNNCTWKGQRGNTIYGGHALKTKAGIQIVYDSYMTNKETEYDLSNMPLWDSGSSSYVWAKNVTFDRQTIGVQEQRDSLVDMRWNQSGYMTRITWPWYEVDATADMETAPPGCGNIKQDYGTYYFQYFDSCTVLSDRQEPFVYRQNGYFWPQDPAVVRANPEQNRAWGFSNNTTAPATKIWSDAAVYQEPDIPTYHCENPPGIPSGLQALFNDKDAFAEYCLAKFREVNPLMWEW